MRLNDKWSDTVARDYSEQWFMYVVLLPDFTALPYAMEGGKTFA